MNTALANDPHAATRARRRWPTSRPSIGSDSSAHPIDAEKTGGVDVMNSDDSLTSRCRALPRIGVSAHPAARRLTTVSDGIRSREIG